jgi:hypothetical protein
LTSAVYGPPEYVYVSVKLKPDVNVSAGGSGLPSPKSNWTVTDGGQPWISDGAPLMVNVTAEEPSWQGP